MSFGNSNVQGHISEHIFTLNGGIDFIIIQVFFGTRCFENWGISLQCAPVLAGVYSVT